MDLKGKSAVFLGDSITAGACADSPEHIYYAVLKDLLGLKQSEGEGVGGTRIAKQKTPSECEIYDHDFIERFDKVDKNADYLFIFGGTNDFGHGDSEFGDAASEDPYTFQGALNVLYTKAEKAFGAEHVVIMMPLRRTGMNNPRGEGRRVIECPPLSEYAKAEKAAAERFGFKVIDLFNEPRLDPNDEKCAAFFADGLHPTTEGHRLLAEILAERIKAL